jgi:hypothetical protein
MAIMRRTRSPTVSTCGAGAGCVLRGVSLSNEGLRLRVSEAQPRGGDGAVKGRFVILDVGDNRHSEALTPFLHRTTDAEEVRDAIRRRYAGAVNVVNANILVPEEPTPSFGDDCDSR